MYNDDRVPPKRFKQRDSLIYKILVERLLCETMSTQCHFNLHAPEHNNESKSSTRPSILLSPKTFII